MATDKAIDKHAKKGRPIKDRIVRKEPTIRQFSPRGRIGRPGYKVLKFEEIETIRLSDYMGLSQREAAKFMGISQQTYSRVLKKARKALAEALINGEIIRVMGGDYTLKVLGGVRKGLEEAREGKTERADDLDSFLKNL